jgi:hypothetical protein
MQLTFDELSTSPEHQDTREQDNLFLSSEHKDLFNEYLRRDRTHKSDRERKAFFYLISGNPDLISKSISRIYDFSEHMLQFSPEAEEMEKYLERFCLCSSSSSLLRLACNLYNSLYPSKYVSDTFAGLGEDNINLCINAMRIRFDRNVQI